MTRTVLKAILACVVLIPPILCNSTNLRYNHNRLKEYLEHKPLRNDPPYYDNDSLLDITLNFSLIAILDIDEVRQVYTFTAYLAVLWEDPELAWNASDFGGISEIMIDPNSIWIPNLYIGNGMDRLRLSDRHYEVKLEARGIVTASISDIFRVTCTINVFKYPFDTQSCALRIASGNTQWKLHAGYIDLPLQDVFATDTEWYLPDKPGVEARVLDTNISSVEIVDFAMTIKRKYLFYIVTTIFPMFLLSVLACFVFLLPAASGDKMSYLISIFVSHTVFLNYVNETMPRTSNSLSLFELYLSFILCHCCLALVATLLVLRAYNKWEQSDQPHNRVSPSEMDDALKPENFKVNNSKVMNISERKINTNNGPKRHFYMTLDACFFIIFLTLALVFPAVLVTYL